MRLTLFMAALAALLPPVVLHSQDCVPPANSNVARMLAYPEGPMAFASLGAVTALPAGAVTIGGELTWVPSPPASITRVDACHTPKSDHPGLAQLLPRPRLIIGLGNGFSVEGMYLPPITVANATPNMGSVALAWAAPVGDRSLHLDLSARALATFGHVRGSITCPRSALQQSDPAGPCWASTPSEDTYEPNAIGAEVAVGRTLGEIRWYGGLGIASIRPRMTVGFTYLNGATDNTVVHIDLTRVSLFGGLTYAVSRTVALSAQLYSVPQDATTGRVGLSWRLR